MSGTARLALQVLVTTMSNEGDSNELKDDLLETFEHDFSFKGNCYFASTPSDAPNPCLSIEGIGTVGIPLSSRDAKAIVACAQQVPRNNSAVGDAWVVGRSKITFENRKWQKWLEDFAFSSVWKALGLDPFQTRPKCQLSNLLLCEQGSHAESVAGMFATVIVVLPTRHEGGQICLSHSGVSETIGPDKEGVLSTSIMAWYADVTHEVKPITSGYRLALSYNLIHTTPNVPLPMLPDMSKGPPRLRDVLTKWQQGNYSSDCFSAESPFFAHVFSDEYPENDLLGGISKMKRPDAYMVAHLLPLAEELGFNVRVASLRYTVAGEARDLDGNCNRKRRRYRSFSSDDEFSEPEADELEVGEVDETICSLTMVVDVEGHPIIKGFNVCDVEVDVLIPENITDCFQSEEREYSGSNGEEKIGFMSERTHRLSTDGLAHVPKKDAEDVTLMLTGGISGAVTRLTSIIGPIAEQSHRAAAEELLRALSTTGKDPSLFYMSSSVSEKALSALLDIALAWKDAGLWQRAMLTPCCTLSTVGKRRLAQILVSFPFESIKDGLASLIQNSELFEDRVEAIKAILTQQEPNQAVVPWVAEQWRESVRTYRQGAEGDTPSILEGLKVSGLTGLTEGLLPNVQNMGNKFPFWVCLAEALYRERDAFPASHPSVDECIEKCLANAALQWDYMPPPPPTHEWSYSIRRTNTYSEEADPKVKATRVAQVIGICLKANAMEACNAILAEVMKDTPPGDLPEKFRDLFVPLIMELQPLLARHGSKLSSPPFSEVIKQIVQLHVDTFSPRNQPTFNGPPLIPRFQCNAISCHECSTLYRFMTSNTTKECVFRTAKDRRHVEGQLQDLRNTLCTYDTTGSRSNQTMVVKKLPTTIALARRYEAVGNRKAFLDLIGREGATIK
ncbi:hypothetical protein BKA70DRAFT_1526623 [Coprinopsis sp. MPI-PUGE-AT-0042]|nr:hypothetical protein BKA70DRAFT_1526623 [Coprinopsis sp. MPI-PUGE-AT-0042]